jgi:hypothetical protein
MAISKIGSKALVDCSVAAVDIEDGSITSAKLAGSIANAKLANSSITVNGTSVSLGASGSIPAVTWQSVITAAGSSNTAVAGQGYFINTTSDVHTVTLPASATAGDTIAIKDYAGTFGTNNLTIARNGHNIQGVANDSLISTNRASLTLVYVDATKGWLYAVESNVADLQSPLFTEATGGTITESGDFKIHSFTGDGCFVVTQLGNSPSVPTGGPTNVDYLVVAGGGGGFAQGGAGGAGGYRTTFPSPGCNAGAFPISTTTYPITVGGGGSGGSGVNGSNSIFSTITSAGGGAATGGGCAAHNGNPGGSGGGGSAPSSGTGGTGGTGNTPPVSPPQGNNGGNGGSSLLSGGGGGAGAAGSNGNPSTGGNGGNGLANSITGSSITRAGGGGGGFWNGVNGPGGSGGSGGGGCAVGPYICGVANTGGGGAGSPAGNNGGKGIVILRYKFQ